MDIDISKSGYGDKIDRLLVLGAKRPPHIDLSVLLPFCRYARSACRWPGRLGVLIYGRTCAFEVLIKSIFSIRDWKSGEGEKTEWRAIGGGRRNMRNNIISFIVYWLSLC